MRHFAEQSRDIAQLILGHQLGRIDENGAVKADGESRSAGESGHIAHGIASYVGFTGQTQLDGENLVEWAARCIASQFFYDRESVEGCSLAALALMALGLNRLRNGAWQQFAPPIQNAIIQWMKMPLKVPPSQQIYAVIQAVVASGMGFVSADESDGPIEQYLIGIQKNSAGGLVDTAEHSPGGCYDASGLGQLILLREVLHRHANVHIRERRLPSLRSCFQKYLRLLPSLVRGDGANWSYGSFTGCLATANSCSLVLCSLADDWIDSQQREFFIHLLRRLSKYFFLNYLDQENGSLLVRDRERDLPVHETSARIIFDTIQQLLLWGHFGQQIRLDFQESGMADPVPLSGGRYISFERTGKKEQGLFVYTDATRDINYQLPLVAPRTFDGCASLAYPHCPGVFEAPANGYHPILVPELTLEGKVVTPSFYGKSVTTGLSTSRDFLFRYEQPDLITSRGEFWPGTASWKVQWTFAPDRVQGDFSLTPRRPLRLDGFRYALALGSPHSQRFLLRAPAIGDEGLRPEILQDDFHGEWHPIRDVSADPNFRSVHGKIHYLLSYVRLLPLQLQTGREYRFSITLAPHIILWERKFLDGSGQD